LLTKQQTDVGWVGRWF